MPRHGVVTLFGYGIQVRVDRGHLILEDGIGAARRYGRFPRVGHGLKRLVIIGADGFVSLAALRWLADQQAAFVMLERDGKVLAVTGPVHPSDARLRRAQALASQTGIATKIAQELINQKLVGQERVARHQLHDHESADTIARFRSLLPTAETPQAIRLLESQAASAYWSAWRTLPIQFPKKDLPRVPELWKTFGARVSPLTGGPRLAVNPCNALINYTGAIAESECRLAACACGLDPGLGFIHADTAARDSLALDLIEAIRPYIEAWLLDWILREPLRRSDYFATANGNCRLMSDLCSKLSETAPTWGKLVAPWAEYVARTLWATTSRSQTGRLIPTRLTQRHRREAKDAPSLPPVRPAPRPKAVCRVCGTSIERGTTYCALCTPTISKENLAEVARVGRVAAQSPEAQARRSTTKRRHDLARRGWMASSLPAWLNNETYEKRIQPRLAEIACSAIASALGVSPPYAADIRAGRRRAHPRHWLVLAQLVDVSPDA